MAKSHTARNLALGVGLVAGTVALNAISKTKKSRMLGSLLKILYGAYLGKAYR